MKDKNDLQAIQHITIDIIVKAIQSAEQANLDMGYTDYRKSLNIAITHLSDAELIEHKLSILPRNASKIMANAHDAFIGNQASKGVKLLYKILQAMGIKKHY